MKAGTRIEDRPDLAGAEVRSRVRELSRIARTDALAAFEEAIEMLGGLAREAARRASEDHEAPQPARLAQPLLRLIGRLLADDAKRERHEIDRESAWFQLFDLWVHDDALALEGFEALLAEAAVLESDRRLLVRLATDELGDLPLVFPGAGEPDVRRVVLKAARSRLESLIAMLLAREGRHAYARAVEEVRKRETGQSAALVEALLRREDSGSAIAAPAHRSPDDLGGVSSARPRALVGAPAGRGRAGRAARRHLETAFLRQPSEKVFHALRDAVPADQWPQIRSRLLGHLQKHQREPTLVFRLYWHEGLLLDADGLVVTQPVDPDVLAHAAMKLASHSPVVAAGWLLVAAYRLADSYPRARWPDVIQHLVLVRDLSARGAPERGFERVLRTFRFRHAHSPDLLSRLTEAGL